MQIGCVRVTERFLTSDPPSTTQLGEARAEVSRQVARAVDDNPRFRTARRLVGLAGTVTTLASLQMGLDEYDPDRIHHSVLAAGDVNDWYRTLASEVRAARLDRAGMVRGREDVIVGGALILDAVMEFLGFDECLVSEADILDGMVAGLLV
jgi:exopolyphosphatase/guanosine-5'-triphosphate,3'-diphosphate pyrophosphatase